MKDRAAIIAEIRDLLRLSGDLTEARAKPARGAGGKIVAQPKTPKASPRPHPFEEIMKRKVAEFEHERRAFWTKKKAEDEVRIAKETKEMSSSQKKAWIKKHYATRGQSVATLVAKDRRDKFPFHGKRAENIFKTKKLADKYRAKIKARRERGEAKRAESHHTFLHPKGSGHSRERADITVAHNRTHSGGFARGHYPYKRRGIIGKTDIQSVASKGKKRGPRSVKKTGEWSCRKIAKYRQFCTKLRNPKVRQKLKALQDRKDLTPDAKRAMRAKIKRPVRMAVNIDPAYKKKYNKKYKDLEKRKRHAEHGRDWKTALHMKYKGSNRHIGK